MNIEQKNAVRKRALNDIRHAIWMRNEYPNTTRDWIPLEDQILDIIKESEKTLND